MISVANMILVATISHAEPVRCEVGFIHECKAAVQGVKHTPADGAALQGVNDVRGTGVDVVSRRDDQVPDAEWAEAFGKCKQLLADCQKKCPTRAHMCEVGMKAPMKLAGKTTEAERQPAAAPVEPRDTREMPELIDRAQKKDLFVPPPLGE